VFFGQGEQSPAVRVRAFSALRCGGFAAVLAFGLSQRTGERPVRSQRSKLFEESLPAGATVGSGATAPRPIDDRVRNRLKLGTCPRVSPGASNRLPTIARLEPGNPQGCGVKTTKISPITHA